MTDRMLYSIPEARQQLGGMGNSTFYAKIATGQIRPTKIGRRTYVSAAELERFVASLTAGGESR